MSAQVDSLAGFGASLLEISGRAFVHVENFKAVVLAVGRAGALKASAEQAGEDVA